MTTLYGQEISGHSTAELATDQKSWEQMESQVAALLRARGQTDAEKALRRCNFRAIYVSEGMRRGSIGALHANLSLANYVWATDSAKIGGRNSVFRTIAETFGEYGFPVDLITARNLPSKDSSAVPPPAIENTSAVVKLALENVASHLRDGTPVSGVDRIHTALHGHLRMLCRNAGLVAEDENEVTILSLWRKLEAAHPAFQGDIAHKDHTAKFLRGMATAFDALNPVRNSGSIAHPNDLLLGEPEARLMIDFGYSFLNYLDRRISVYKKSQAPAVANGP